MVRKLLTGTRRIPVIPPQPMEGRPGLIVAREVDRRTQQIIGNWVVASPGQPARLELVRPG
jgi:hypothetical protein